MNIKINEQLKTITGKNFVSDGDQAATFKSAVIVCCEMYKPEKVIPGRAIKVLAIGTKLFNCKEDEIELSDEEITILKDVIENNPIYITGLTGALLNLLEVK